MGAETTRTVLAGSVQLAVVERGRGQPLVFVHGFPLNHSMWDAQIAAFADRYRVIAPDLRGCGRSQVTAGTVTMEQMADDLAALLDALAVTEPVVLCGLSMGGYVAFQFWRKYRSRLRALVLCDTRALPDTPQGAIDRRKLADDVIREGPQFGLEEALKKAFAAATFQNQPGVIDAMRRTILETSPEGVAAALRGMAERPDVRQSLPQIALPTLVIVGEHDEISPVEEMRTLAQAIPGSEFVVIGGAGHMTPTEAPAAFNAALERFLARLEA